MKIGIDCDEVLVNLVGPFLEFNRERYGKVVERAGVFSYDFSEVLGITKDEDYKRFSEFFNSDYVSRILPLEGSQKAIIILSKRNELYVITSRPLSIKDATKKLIESNYGGSFLEIHHTDEITDFTFKKADGKRRTLKVDICKKLNVELMIEDSLDKAISCAEGGINTFLMDTPWNQNGTLPKNIKRVYGWEHILNELNNGAS